MRWNGAKSGQAENSEQRSKAHWAIAYFSTASHALNRDLGLTAEATVHLPKPTWKSIFGSCSKLSEGETVDGVSYNMKIQNETHLNVYWGIFQCPKTFKFYHSEHLWKTKLLLLLLNWEAKGQYFIKYVMRCLARHGTTTPFTITQRPVLAGVKHEGFSCLQSTTNYCH